MSIKKNTTLPKVLRIVALIKAIEDEDLLDWFKNELLMNVNEDFAKKINGLDL